MVGSTAAVIAVPIVATISVAIWLILVFYADRHPQWHTDDSSRVPHPSSVTTRASRPISIPAQHSASTDTTRSPV
jgi:hypothetical protein